MGLTVSPLYSHVTLTIIYVVDPGTLRKITR